MSLKAKIEAVIYASEEPVTLSQLVGLLGEEGSAELEGLRSRQTSLALAAESDPEPEVGADEAFTSEMLSLNSGLDPDAPADSSSTTPEPGPSPLDDTATDGMATQEKKLARESAAGAKAQERALRDYFRTLLEQLMSDYLNEDRGLEVREVAGGYRLATKPEYHDAVRGFVKSLKPPLKLSLQALETLAVVAYKQPVTSPEISEIRGVDSGGVLGGLMARKLITTAGRKQVIGRPILYKTTKDFLVRFGLKDINELPSIEEFEKLAGEFADAEPVQEEIPMYEPDQLVSGEGTNETKAGHDEARSAPTGSETSSSGSGSGEPDVPKDEVRHPDNPLEIEPMADIHEPQADGDSSPTDVETEP